MKESEKIAAVSAWVYQIMIRNRITGDEGVADLANTPGNIAIWYGNDDGSDDKTITAEEFDSEWIVTNVQCVG